MPHTGKWWGKKTQLGRQLQSMVKRPLLESCALAKPSAIEPVLLTSGTAFVVNKLRHR